MSTLQTRIANLVSRRKFGMKPGLERMQKILDKIGHPEQTFLPIHIAGTNGKGSVAAMLSSILTKSNFGPIGLYTSPHLYYFNERIAINGTPISNEILEEALTRLEPHFEDATFFECTTALAFEIFRLQKVKIAVIETGLGGRLDATNVITPILSIITGIGLEHCEYLGNTIEEIATEKGGIIKPNRPVIISDAIPPPAQAILRQIAISQNSPILNYDPTITPTSLSDTERTITNINYALTGKYQLINLQTTINAIEAFSSITNLPITSTAIKEGLQTVTWPCRFQTISTTPHIIIDGAHNPSAAQALVDSLKPIARHHPITLIAGFCFDKDSPRILSILHKITNIAIATPIPSDRTLTSAETASRMRAASFTSVREATSWQHALTLADPSTTIVICGSLFLAGAVAASYHALPFPPGISTPSESLKK